MTYDFPSHIKGDTWYGINSITITSEGVPVNLENSTIIIQVRSSKNSASPLVYEFSTLTNTISTISQSLGIIAIPPQVVNIPVGEYEYDLTVLFENGSIRPYLRGKWMILDCDQE